MRTSLKNIKMVDDFAMGTITPEDAVLFQANILLHPDLAEELRLQLETHAVILAYSRGELKREVAAAGKRFFNAPQYSGIIEYVRSLFLGR